MGAFTICVLLIALTSVSSKPIDIIKAAQIIEDPNVNSVGVANKTDEAALSSEVVNITRLMRNSIRPGMVVNSYAVELTPDVDEGTFEGKTVTQVSITDALTRDDEIMFHISEDMEIISVEFALMGSDAFFQAEFNVDDNVLIIEPHIPAAMYTFSIEYTGSLEIFGRGLFVGHYDGNTYLAMNLHPIYARRVFPCVDEPTEVSIISFTVNDAGYNTMVSNAMLEEGSQTQFRALQGPPHLWGLVAHNFININVPVANVLLHGRPGVSNQNSQQASVAINFFFNNLNEWTNRPYLEILVNQDGRMNIIALPDVSRDWHALSTIGIWEPYIVMEAGCSVKQWKLALEKIAESMAKQWFGFVIFPENWRYEWVVSGLASYAGYEMLRMFQQDVATDVTLLDINTLFVTEVIQESLLLDSYQNAQPLELEEDIFEEDDILNHVFGILKYKAPALMRMWRVVLGDAQQDFIQSAGRALLAGRALQTVNSLNFVDALNSGWLANGNGMVGDIAEYLEPWIQNSGYPVLHVSLRQGGVLLTQERFGFSTTPHINFPIPISFTTSINPDFSDARIHPVSMLDNTDTLNMALDEEDWVLFNIQGQGYYRVNYDDSLWERIIAALEDPERREEIHPLNRATLVDDALNLARAGKIDYDIAFRIVLSMEHETEYAVWKAFVRNMDFLRKRLIALVEDDEDLDPDIYERMVRRTIGTIEDELGFQPETSSTEPAMHTLTRGLVMEHACKANYQPCVAAAVDLFLDPNSNERQVNPNIPHEIRPAVYCTMVREGDDDTVRLLYERLAIEPTEYERVVILESLACSQDQNFIRTLLEETIAANSPYGAEERVRIYAAVVSSSTENAGVALNFITMRTAEIRNRYGGQEKLEELIFATADSMVDNPLATDFRIWVQAQNNNLDESQMAALRALSQVLENLAWNDAHLEEVYEWIDENHASSIVVSLVVLCVSLLIGFLNH